MPEGCWGRPGARGAPLSPPGLLEGILGHVGHPLSPAPHLCSLLASARECRLACSCDEHGAEQEPGGQEVTAEGLLLTWRHQAVRAEPHLQGAGPPRSLGGGC